MSELPSHFVAKEPSSPDSTLETLANPELLQAQLVVQTIQRFKALELEIRRILNESARHEAWDKLDALGLKAYGRAWEVLKLSGVEPIPIVLGGISGPELENKLTKHGVSIDEFASRLLRHPDFEANRVQTPTPFVLVRMTAIGLGFLSIGTTKQIYAKAAELGFERCPSDAGPLLSLQLTGNNWGTIGMKPINRDVDYPAAFWVDYSTDGRKLKTASASFDRDWDDNSPWVFALPLDRLIHTPGNKQ